MRVQGLRLRYRRFDEGISQWVSKLPFIPFFGYFIAPVVASIAKGLIWHFSAYIFDAINNNSRKQSHLKI